MTVPEGVILGALLAGIFGLVVAWLNQKFENKRWLKTERLRIYSDFMSTATEIARILRLEGSLAVGETRITNLVSLRNQLFLVGPVKAAEAASKQQEALLDMYYMKREETESNLLVSLASNNAAIIFNECINENWIVKRYVLRYHHRHLVRKFSKK